MPIQHPYLQCLDLIPPPLPLADHIKYGVHAKECPTHGKCMNCMPIDGKYTCWAIKKPVMYHLTNWGKVRCSLVSAVFPSMPCARSIPIHCPLNLNTLCCGA